jgi:uncharacterized membrane protein
VDQNHSSPKSLGNAENSPLLADILERNIQTIARLRLKTAKERSLANQVADGVTSFSGNLVFVYIHIAWFGIWILLNTGRLGVAPFDPFPYGLLTMVVSLEAIFLSTFVLISQNRLSEDAEKRADLNLQIALLTEHEVTLVLKILDRIEGKLGVERDHDEDLLDLEMETKPEDVLAEIARLQQAALKRRQSEP